MRFLRHLLMDSWSVRRAFPRRAMEAIERAIVEQERRHEGELRFAVEAALPLTDFARGVSAHERAIDVFGRLRVWDTEQNCGVLIYLLLADKRVEIVADRGIHHRVGAAAWEAICGAMQREFAAGRFEHGAIVGVQAISDLLATHYPPRGENPDELANRPVVV
ncbi:MAG: TPM domain-containing protein [Burkholderiales bacterium]